MGNVWLETVVPVVGGFVAMALFGSPVRDVLKAKRDGDIGELNILPFIFIMANCASWVAYSMIIDNWYIFIPNWLGFLIGIFLFGTAYGVGVSDVKARDRLLFTLLFLAALIPWVGAIDRIILTNDDARQTLWGYFANVILFCFYMSPLSTMFRVIKQRNSASLVLPLCIMNVCNGGLWFTYGLAVGDSFIWVPNGTGAVLGLLQTSLCIVFPRRESDLPCVSQPSSAVPPGSTAESLPGSALIALKEQLACARPVAPCDSERKSTSLPSKVLWSVDDLQRRGSHSAPLD